MRIARRSVFGPIGLLAVIVVLSPPALDTGMAQQASKTANAKARSKANNKNKNNRMPVQRATQLAPAAPKSSLLTQKNWENLSQSPLQPDEIDRLITKALGGIQIEPAPVTTDAEFIRRITLDLTGKLPVPADVSEFSADPNSNKRSRLIDKLLNSDEYAAHWARYWRDVIAARVTDRKGLVLAQSFEEWMTEQLKKNQGWDKIVRAMLCAEGAARADDKGTGAAFFLASRFGPDAANEQAAETSRLFLGIQIQCAQCHDHPSDQWKRVQFHELVGYFARLRERPIRDGGPFAGIELVSLPRGEHEMESKEDPSKTLLTNPRFLDGKSPGVNLTDQNRRKALADALVSKRNCWFAAAFVNRMWGELMGQSFYQPIDDMGPEKQVVFGSTLTRLSGAFQGTNYNIKDLFRNILSSDTYQRQIRLGESSDQHMHFAASYPTRLRADALWDSLVGVLGNLTDPRGRQAAQPLAQRRLPAGLEGLFKQEFRTDPSLKADEVEGSISQALLMMNNPVINQRIQAQGSNLLARILKFYPEDRKAIEMVYLRTLARHPTDKEMEKCLQHLQDAERRNEGMEDVLWALLNSTEFQTKR